MFDGVGISFGVGFGFGFDDDAPKRKGKGCSPKQAKQPKTHRSEPYRPYGETRPGENIHWGYGPARPSSSSGTDSLSSSPGKSEASFGAGSPPKSPQPPPPQAPTGQAQSSTSDTQPPAAPTDVVKQ